MQILSFRTNEDNGLSFELLIDSKPLEELLASACTFFPYWIATQGIPTFPPLASRSDSMELIVGACSCGEYGCGNLHCKAELTETTVVFSDFDDETGKLDPAIKFIFSRENYNDISSQIASKAKTYLPAQA